MSQRCVQEPHVRHAAVTDRWTDAIGAHISQCADCAATAAAAPFMAALARTAVRPRALADPAVLWLKAQLLRGSAVAERAARPLNIAQLLSYVVIASGWAGLLTWKWTDVQRWLLSVTPANIVGSLAGVEPSVSATVIVAVVVLSSLTVMLALHAILAEE